MNFSIETSRSQSIDALTCAKNIFRDHLHDHSDAIFTDARRDRIIAFSGSKYEAPICYHLVNDPIIYDYLNSFKEDVLINHDNDTFTIVHNGKKEALDTKIADRVKAIYDTILLSPGIMNKNGEIEIDLNAFPAGTVDQRELLFRPLDPVPPADAFHVADMERDVVPLCDLDHFTDRLIRPVALAPDVRRDRNAGAGERR